MNQLKAKLEKVILKHLTKSSIHGLNNTAISAKKVENVKALHNIKGENVWFIYDATLFGSAKDGMVFTNRAIYWREVLESPQKLEYIEMIESTANQDLKAKVIVILDKAGEIAIKEVYYNLISEFRLEIVKSSPVYDTYYRSGLQSVEESLIRLYEKGQFCQIIEWLKKYEGLYLRPKHKSVKIHEISFEAYLREQMFSKAQEELDILKNRGPLFYKKAIELLALQMKNTQQKGLKETELNPIKKDEYGMGELSYFALKADVEGILKILDQTDFLLMPANIFGHDFVDLIGFACDPCLGNKQGNLLDILEKIKHKIDLKQVNDRIKFLKTGQEGEFFSYKLSQEERLKELNEKLMSRDYFRHILRTIEGHTHNDSDVIIKHIFTQELEALAIYPKKDEFETADAYKKRCQDFKQRYSSRTDFIEEYKRQNQNVVEGIIKLVADNEGCFIPAISAFIEYKNKELEALRSLEYPEGMLALLDLYFPIKDEVITVDIGTYDVEREVFLMIIDGKVQELRMPRSIAKQYKRTFPQMEYIRRREIKDGKVILKIATKYDLF